MALTFKDKGRLFGIVKDGRYNGKFINIDTDDNKDTFDELSINDGKFQLCPDPNTERQILYITGPSGSGKSTFTANYTKLYKKIFKKNPIYVFSALKDDESLDVVQPKRFRISKETLLDDPIIIEDLKNSLVIFDDIDSISNKELKNAVYSILDSILTTGRHFSISCIITNHLPTGGHLTRQVLNESHYIVYFPHSGNNGKLKKFLIDQIGLDNKDYVKNKQLKSRWACVAKNYPMACMTEKNIRILGDEDMENLPKIKNKKKEG